jgi:hypothetical protein
VTAKIVDVFFGKSLPRVNCAIANKERRLAAFSSSVRIVAIDEARANSETTLRRDPMQSSGKSANRPACAA